MSITLAGKTALITGASSGIGAATARTLSEAGANVVLTGRRIEQLESLAESLPNEALAVRLDVTDRASVAAAVAATVEKFGGVDILVNNAGIMLSGMVEGADVEEWTRMVETNLLGSLYLVHETLPSILSRKGAIVQVSSTSGRFARMGGAVYAATKFGVTAFAEALRQEVTSRGVRVITVEPGFTETELTSHITNPAMQDMAKGLAASMRLLRPEDVAEAIRYSVTQPEHVSVSEILIRPTDEV
ncbi:SDR family oxidoreductase [Leifsonia poae]|uniref:SDR family oxidoreductase n=1 Tax=Leifsonia poae TaxID=110933 RepID=UPI003D66B5E9